jgi:PHD/YefM family antitoxin component YafN of YafNO toxin-antitoxin module
MVKTINLKKTTKSELIELIRKLKRRKDDQYFLQENGKAMAVLISQAEYEKYREEQRLKAVERLQKLMSEVHAKIPQDMSEDEVEREVNEAIHEMRGIKC